MRGVADRLLAKASVFEPRRRLLGVVRSMIALAELSGLVVTPDHTLFAYGIGLPRTAHCDGVRRLSLWCVTGQSDTALSVDRVAVIVILVAVVSGYRPRWTAVPHWFVAFSVHNDVTLGDGGDAVAAIVTMLLIPILLGDGRTWHWSRASVLLGPSWRGSSYAAWLVLRCQIVIIYTQASLSKLRFSEWSRGTAIQTIFVDPNTGLPMAVRRAFEPFFTSRMVTTVLSWTVIVGELVIAFCALAIRWRRVGVVVTCLLHGGIAITMGLFAFSAIMVATVLMLCADSDSDTANRGLRLPHMAPRASPDASEPSLPSPEPLST